MTNLCVSIRCVNPILTPIEKKIKIPRLERPVREKRMRTFGTSKQVQRKRRCGECEGCTAEDCGTCTACKINLKFSESETFLGKNTCLSRECKKPIDVTFGDNRWATGRCRNCDGCNAPECGECDPCKGNPKFGGSDNPPKQCLATLCQKTKTFAKASPMIKMMAPVSYTHLTLPTNREV